jgi:S1-C subfamily serine protease
MSSGPFFSDRHQRVARLWNALGGFALGFALAAALRAPSVAAQPLPPPPANSDMVRKVPLQPLAPRPVPCPRCGYLCDPAWHYCVACGWDRTRLIDQAEEDRLRTIARAVVGVIVEGNPNQYATAFPLGEPGLLVTTARILVTADPAAVKVRTYNNQEYSAIIVGYDAPTGVGLLKADIPRPGPIEMARENPAPPASSWVVCYPVVREDDVVHLLPVSLHLGSLTSIGQSGTALVSFENLLQTDHAIEDGCRGAPLIDSRGQISGMVLGSPEDGITFAAPARSLPEVAVALASGAPPIRPFFGMGLVLPDDRRRHKFHLDPAESRPLVPYLIPGSPAAQAGVRAGDLLLGVDGM